jgi:hypothetical protein
VIISLKNFQETTKFKTYKDRVKLVICYDLPTVIMLTSEDKMVIYDVNKPLPKKQFKIQTGKIVDIVMPSG